MNEPAQQTTTSQATGRLRQLSLSHAIRFSWQSIRVRFWRSMLVTSSIILAVAFLSYVLCSNAITQSIAEKAPARLLDELKIKGLFMLPDADAKIQMRWLVGLALLVSFVGVLNAMLLSVTERFREIGTMKCLGALDKLIVQLLLIESVFHGTVGSFGGILVGVSLALIEAARLVGPELWGLAPLPLLARIVGICFAAGSLLTIVGALYPALIAARMQPVEALRSEA